MKKIIAVTALFVVITGAAFGQFVEEYDGWQWRSWSVENRYMYIIGYMSATVAHWDLFFQTAETELDQQMLADLFYIPESVASLATMLNDFYRGTQARDVPIIFAIQYLTGRDWWNPDSGPRSPAPNFDSSGNLQAP